VPVLNNVRYASDSDHSRYESELTLWARSDRVRYLKHWRYSAISLATIDCHDPRQVAGRFLGETIKIRWFGVEGRCRAATLANAGKMIPVQERGYDYDARIKLWLSSRKELSSPPAEALSSR
jgi:hypothetical protein